MRVNADSLGAQGFRIELDSAHSATPNVIELGPSKGISGTYLHGLDRIEIRAVRGTLLDLRAFEWQFATGAVHLDGGALLREVHVDLTIDRTAADSGLSGVIECGSGTLERAVMRFGTFEASATVELGGFRWVAAPGGELTLHAATVALRDTTFAWEGGSADVGSIDLGPTKIRMQGDRRVVELDSASIGAVKATLGGVVAEIHGGQLPRGVRVTQSGGDGSATTEVELGELLAERILIDVPDVAGTAPEPPPLPAGPRTDSAQRQGTAPIDLTFLDGLHGQIDVDLRIVTDIAVIGRRDKTHQFRIPVRRGEINYRSLERDLGTLEDAFIDIEVRDGKLSIENDIPLLPFYYRSLVLFRIPPDEVVKAANERLVKLRTFAEWELPEPSDRSKRKKGKKKNSSSPVDIVALDAENIDLALGLDREALIDLGPTGKLRLGGPDTPPLGALTVRGAVRHRPGSDPQPGELVASVDGIAFGLDTLRLGGQLLSIASARLEAIESARQELLGLRPGRLRIEARGLDLDGLTLQAAPAAAAAPAPPAAPAPL